MEAKGENGEALSIYNKGNDINPMWDYLLQNKVRLLANMNNKEAAYALQKILIDKASNDPVLLKKRYSDLSLLQWSFDDKNEAIASAKKAGNKGLIKYFKDGDITIMKKKVDEYYIELKKSSEYISQLWMGVDYAYAGDREKALECFDNAVALKETAISLLLIRDYSFFTIKYLNMALITRKIKKLINF
jgi:tetratricopeptide (TPR) repeat protein